MSCAQTILNAKGNDVHVIHHSESLMHAAQRMNQHHIGSLLVMADGREPMGIVTERDILHAVAAGLDQLARATVGDVMSRPVLCCKKTSSLDAIRSMMKENHIRHLPVTDDDGTILGIISMTDVSSFLVDEEEQTIECLQEYLYTRV